MENKFFKECFLQDVYHYEALEVWEELKIGLKLSLEKDEDKNKKVVLVYKKEDEKKDDDKKENNGKHIIGRLSDDDAKFIYDIIEAEHNDVFEGFVSFKSDETADENKRLKVVIKIKNKQKIQEETKLQENKHKINE